jgi:putative PIN family toxin of toxin-antitoxin system
MSYVMHITVDTNVLVGALKSSTGASHAIFQALALKKISWCVSTTLYWEYKDVLGRPELNIAEDVRELALKVISNHAKLVNPMYFHLHPTLADIKDVKVLEVAFATGTDIVTLNRKDFIDHAHHFGVQILSPYEYLMRIRSMK